VLPGAAVMFCNRPVAGTLMGKGAGQYSGNVGLTQALQSPLRSSMSATAPLTAL